MNKKITLCQLQSPATCEHRVDGKMSFTSLCGNNPLNDSYIKCPYKQNAVINVTSHENTNILVQNKINEAVVAIEKIMVYRDLMPQEGLLRKEIERIFC